MALFPMSPDDSHRYAGFWIRAGSQILDMQMTLPIIAVIAWIDASYRLGPLYALLPSLAFSLFFAVYLVYRFGGTPGKLLLAIRITSVDGSRVTSRQAFIREAPTLALTVLSTVGQCVTLLRVSDAEFYGHSWLERQQYLSQFAPRWVFLVAILMQLWTWSELIVMLTNRQRRALHDFIAGTVLIKKEYADPIQIPAEEV